MRRPFGLGLLGLLAAAPASASTGFREFANYCTFGSPFVTCATIQIFTVALAGGWTDVEVRVRNLEGTHPLATVEGSLPGYGETILGLMTMGTLAQTANGYRQIQPYDRGFTWGAVGSVYGAADALDPGWDGGCDPVTLYCYVNRYEMWPAIWGCDVDPLVGDIADPNWMGLGFGGGFQTCPKLGYTGWVQFKWRFATDISADELFVSWNEGIGSCVVGTLADSDEGHSRGLGSQCAQYSPTTLTVTPEPSTRALMLTGLVGMGLVVRRRRRG
jgi:hypothetical protein